MIKGFRPFSYDLQRAIEHYAQLISLTTDNDERVFANMSCVFFAASFVEAKLNEWTRIANEIEDGPIPIEFWKTLISSEKTLSVKEKWNLIASVSGGTLWAADREPFQSWESLMALRNELVHFKAELLPAGVFPTNRIKALFSKIVVAPTYAEPQGSAWLLNLLSSSELSSHVRDVVNAGR